MSIPKGILLPPAIRKEDNAFSKLGAGSFCWRDGWGSRYESLWSLLHKFALLNAADSIGIREVLSVEPTNNDALRYRNRADLRYFGALDPAKLAIVFRSSKELIDESVVSRHHSSIIGF